jgi:hypothetical protein
VFRFWLHHHPLLILIELMLVFAVSGSLIHWLQCRSPLRAQMRRRPFAAPTFASVSTLFALFAGFLLANAIGQKTRALQAVQTEAAALMTLRIDGEAVGAAGAAIRDAAAAYARSVVAAEWPRMLEESASPVTGEALTTLLRAAAGLPAADVPPALHGQMLALAQKVAGARAERVAIVGTHLQQFAWTGLFLLGFVTQFGIGMAHLERAPNRLAIGFFSVGAVVGLWLIAIQDNPFRGYQPVSPAAFEAVIAADGR